MKRAKGLSFDEKKEALLKAMLAESSIYNMSELESLGKRNKVIPQAVKEVIEALISDRAVIMEKIGTQNIYWAFSSQRKAQLLSDCEKLKFDCALLTKQLDDARKTQQQAREGVKMDEKARGILCKEISQFEYQTRELKDKIIQGQKIDPRKTSAQIEELKKAKIACDVWTGNIFSLRIFFVDKFDCPDSLVDQRFDIPDNIDYL